MKTKVLLLLSFFICLGVMQSQEYFPKNNGLKEKNLNYTAFVNATIHTSPTSQLTNATLLIQDGKVKAVGTNLTLPENTVIIEASGTHIYPSFIDAYTDFGVAKPKRASGSGRSPQYEASREGFYWNDHIMPEQQAINFFKYDSKSAKALRASGFGLVNTHRMDGIARGTGVLVALNDGVNDAARILEDQSGQFFSFSKSIASRQSYPTSLMGSMALLRQLYNDMIWYEGGNANTKDRSIEALIENKNKVQFFEAGDKYNNIRADKIADQFNLNYVIVGGGNEYEAIESIKQTQAKYIIPINFPNAIDVSDPFQANYVSLADMRKWNQAPSNLSTLEAHNIPFALSTHTLKTPSAFTKNLQKALTYGFSETAALKALTTTPAEILGISNQVGTLEKGKWANFLITSGPIFDANTTLYENWVQGVKHTLKDRNQEDIRGTYNMQAGNISGTLEITGAHLNPKTKLKVQDSVWPSKITYENGWVNLQVTNKDTKEVYQAIARVMPKSDALNGKWRTPNGSEITFNAQKTKAYTTEDKKKENAASSTPEMVPITYPNIGYGFKQKPTSKTLLFKNATVWTSEDTGILEATDVLVKNGKIVKIGKNLSASNATIIDATGKHLTAGIIDEHSHIAALSINEAGHNSSAEVKISDVVDPEDVNIYRNLAGGVTSIQILHGSANPIGGRSAIIKLKWGEDADGMLYNNSPKFIKFALGENVKQSNWQSFSRFPQTRMGVEQVFVNYFNRAREYDALKKSGKAYRYDEEMEVLAEILNGERFISCHSYVQSEINMLMKVAESFNFRVNTFTHILEGYKVADKMKAHGVGGSTFSDWWAYKYEVNDAIPYNAAIMNSQGVTVAINSDDAEMSRRLNQEAAKSVKYGGMSEEEAWKMVTINPAKLLHLDDKVGSIKEGKDADLVLWNNNPLSVTARAEKTFIEGALYFDIEQDKMHQIAIKEERNKLMKMMLDAKKGGAKMSAPRQKHNRLLHCDSL